MQPPGKERGHHQRHIPFAPGQRRIGSVHRLIGDTVIEAHDDPSVRFADHLDVLIRRIALGECALRLLHQAGGEDQQDDDQPAGDQGRPHQERDGHEGHEESCAEQRPLRAHAGDEHEG